MISQSPHAALLPQFVKSCGFGLGLEFRDASLLLTERNSRLIQAGQCFNLSIGFTELQTASAGRRYAVYLADTVLVREAPVTPPGQQPLYCESLTKMPREYKDITYLIGAEGDDDQAAAADAGDGAAADALDSAEAAPGARSTRGSSHRSSAAAAEDSADAAANEKVRAAHQAELARKQREIAMRKLAAEAADGAFNSGLDEQQRRTLQAYASPASFPAAARRDRIFVDIAAEALLLPVHDQLVPFHINTVKNVRRQEEGAFTSLRITFFTPDAKLTAAQQSLGIGNPNAASAASASSSSPGSSALLRYISELSFRTASNSLDKVFFDIKELRKRVQNRLKEFEAKSSLVLQPDLVLERRGIIPTLKEVSARPQLSRKKTTGTLAAHSNGLRYSTSDKFKVDVLYANIKAAFYQPAEDTHQVLLHFELRHPILLDRSKTKKTSFLQIYYEVVDVSEDLSSSNRYRDEDGLLEEQQERIRRKRWNERFLDFVKQVETKLSDAQAAGLTGLDGGRLEFDIPYRELAFTGVPAKSSVDIMPTVHSLVALDDSPPLVLPLNEVEIAVFERVQFGLRNFDLVFVYRDFSRLPMRIDSIPMRFLEPIKHWLNSCDIVYYESNQNLLWKAVMKHINSDVEDFWRQGGWSFLAEDDEQDAEREAAGEDGEAAGGGAAAQESESEFELDSAEEAEADDSEEYETPSDEEDEAGDDDDDDEEEDGSDAGEDWDELENEAKRQDRQKRDKQREKGERDFSDDDDDDRERDRDRPQQKQQQKASSSSSSSSRPKPAQPQPKQKQPQPQQHRAAPRSSEQEMSGRLCC